MRITVYRRIYVYYSSHSKKATIIAKIVQSTIHKMDICLQGHMFAGTTYMMEKLYDNEKIIVIKKK